MRCPKCQKDETKVVDSRPAADGLAIRRRRECESCGFRFSTYEEIEILDLLVDKRDGGAEPYAREKLERGIRKAFWKLPLQEETLKKLLTLVEQDIQKKAASGHISSKEIGQVVMKHLKKIDKVAYIRFAAVYLQFEEVQDFKDELEKL